MATYGGGSIILEAVYESSATITSSSGVIGANQVFFTVSGEAFTHWNLLGVANVTGTTGTATLNCSLQRLGINYASYYNLIDFTLSINSTAGSTENRNVEISSVTDFESNGRIVQGVTTGAGKPMLTLFDGERLIVRNGTCTNGTNWRLTWQRIRHYNSQ